MHRHRFDPHFAGGADDSKSNFAPVP